MTTVAAGQTGTITLDASSTITVTLDPSEKAYVTVTRDGAQLFAGVIGNTSTIGPYASGDVVTFTAQRTAIDYTVDGYTPPTTGGGTSTLAGATDYETADLVADNTSVATLAATVATNTDDIAGKSDLLPAVTLDASTSLTAASHANRTINVTGASRVLTIQADADSGATSDEVFRAVPLSGASCTMVADTGVTILSASGSSLDSSTSATGEIAVQRVGVDTYRAITAAAGSATAGAHRTLAVAARVADAATASTSETVVATFTLPALGVNDSIDVEIFMSGSGTAGNRIWSLRLGGTGTDGTTVSNYTGGATFPVSRALLGFANTGSASVQFGLNGGSTAGFGYNNSTASRAGAVDTSTSKTLYLTLLKGNAADVVNLEAARCILKPGV